MTYNIAYEIERTIIISCRVGYLEGIILETMQTLGFNKNMKLQRILRI